MKILETTLVKREISMLDNLDNSSNDVVSVPFCEAFDKAKDISMNFGTYVFLISEVNGYRISTDIKDLEDEKNIEIIMYAGEIV
jgi:PleD family two-component response regulator